jgi:phospholipid/cholesterol/gamma-HCH transport system substrate-binding protein
VGDYDSTQARRNTLVGIFVIAALVALAYLIFKFNDMPGTVRELTSFKIYAKFPSAQGVQKDTPVQFCGYQIGRVTEIMPPQARLDENTGEKYHQTMCVISIDKKYKNIPSTVDIKVITRQLGSSYIELFENYNKELTPKDPKRPETKYLVEGMEMQGITGPNLESLIVDSKGKIDKLIDKIGLLVDNTNAIVGDADNQTNIKETLANINDISVKAAALMDEFQTFMQSSNQVSEQALETISQIRRIVQKINDGQGTAGKFINDGRLYENLLDSTEQLQVLMKDLKNFLDESREEGLKLKHF